MTDLPTEAQQALDQFDGRQSDAEAADRLRNALAEEESRG